MPMDDQMDIGDLLQVPLTMALICHKQKRVGKWPQTIRYNRMTAIRYYCRTLSHTLNTAKVEKAISVGCLWLYLMKGKIVATSHLLKRFDFVSDKRRPSFQCLTKGLCLWRTSIDVKDGKLHAYYIHIIAEYLTN